MGFVRFSNISKALNIVVKFCCKILYNIKPDWNVELKHINIVIALNKKTVCDLGWVLFIFVVLWFGLCFDGVTSFVPSCFKCQTKNQVFFFLSNFLSLKPSSLLTLSLGLWFFCVCSYKLYHWFRLSSNFPQCLETFQSVLKHSSVSGNFSDFL